MGPIIALSPGQWGGCKVSTRQYETGLRRAASLWGGSGEEVGIVSQSLAEHKQICRGTR